MKNKITIIPKKLGNTYIVAFDSNKKEYTFPLVISSILNTHIWLFLKHSIAIGCDDESTGMKINSDIKSNHLIPIALSYDKYPSKISCDRKSENFSISYHANVDESDQLVSVKGKYQYDGSILTLKSDDLSFIEKDFEFVITYEDIVKFLATFKHDLTNHYKQIYEGVNYVTITYYLEGSKIL